MILIVQDVIFFSKCPSLTHTHECAAMNVISMFPSYLYIIIILYIVQTTRFYVMV